MSNDLEDRVATLELQMSEMTSQVSVACEAIRMMATTCERIEDCTRELRGLVQTLTKQVKPVPPPHRTWLSRLGLTAS